ncbi:MAG: right-handed parallel beta-helix repeat-containing protein [Candidatus Kariarchaeaceae archaeon]
MANTEVQSDQMSNRINLEYDEQVGIGETLTPQTSHIAGSDVCGTTNPGGLWWSTTAYTIDWDTINGDDTMIIEPDFDYMYSNPVYIKYQADYFSLDPVLNQYVLEFSQYDFFFVNGTGKEYGAVLAWFSTSDRDYRVDLIVSVNGIVVGQESYDFPSMNKMSFVNGLQRVSSWTSANEGIDSDFDNLNDTIKILEWFVYDFPVTSRIDIEYTLSYFNVSIGSYIELERFNETNFASGSGTFDVINWWYVPFDGDYQINRTVFLDGIQWQFTFKDLPGLTAFKGGSNPRVFGPLDFSYVLGSSPSTITWAASHQNPLDYFVYYNANLIQNGNWDKDFEVEIDISTYVNLGIENFTIVMRDTFGQSTTHTVLVDVVPEQVFSVHAPIYIDYNDGFKDQGFKGSGTKMDPYRITGLSISAQEVTLIHIVTTDAHVCIQNNILDGAVSFTTGDGIHLDTASNIDIFNNTIQHSAGNGILVFGGQNLSIADNYIHDNSGAGIGLGLTSRDNVVSGNQITRNIGGIVIEQSSIYHQVSWNTLEENLDFGISLSNAHNNTLTDNTVFNHGMSGIEVSASNNNEISRNIVYFSFVGLSSQSGMVIGTGSFGNNILDNIIYGHDLEGIGVYDSESNLLDGNIIYSNGAGIVLWNNARFNELRNNEVSLNTAEGIGLHFANNNSITENIIHDNNDGIVIYDTSNFVNIRSNEIYNNIAQGLSLVGTGIEVDKNDIHDNIDGITFRTGSTDSVITQNTITQHASVSIFLQASNNIIVDDNIISNDVIGSDTWGIQLGGSNNNRITRNDVSKIEFAITLSSSSGNQIDDNLSHDNVNGIFVNDNSNGNNFTRNSVLDNVHGIFTDNADNNRIEFNDIQRNDAQGIFIGANGNSVLNNTITQNNLGMELGPGSTDNVIKWNEFYLKNIGGLQALDDGVNNSFESNFWDDWTGPDADGDGIVDVPYLIPSSSNPEANMDPKPIARDQTTSTTSTTSSETKTTTTSTTESSSSDDESDAPSAFLSFSIWYLGIFLLGFIGFIRKRK